MNPAQAQTHPHQDYSAADEALFSTISWHLLPLLIRFVGQLVEGHFAVRM